MSGPSGSRPVDTELLRRFFDTTGSAPVASTSASSGGSAIGGSGAGGSDEDLSLAGLDDLSRPLPVQWQRTVSGPQSSPLRLSGDDIDVIVERVVERVERRMVEEMERRGRQFDGGAY